MLDIAPVALRRMAAALTAAGLASLVLSPALRAQSSPPPETPAGRILYHEESGGMTRPVAPATGPGSSPKGGAPADAPRKGEAGEKARKPASEPAPRLPPPLPPRLETPTAAAPKATKAA